MRKTYEDNINIESFLVRYKQILDFTIFPSNLKQLHDVVLLTQSPLLLEEITYIFEAIIIQLLIDLWPC